MEEKLNLWNLYIEENASPDWVKEENRIWVAGWQLGMEDATRDLIKAAAEAESNRQEVPNEIWDLIIQWRNQVSAAYTGDAG